MAVFLTLLPIYIFGNFHCIGMCGPLVALLGKHRYRYYYFLGRFGAFSLAGFLAGGLGAVVHAVFYDFHLAAVVSFFFGIVILWSGVVTLFPGTFSWGLGRSRFFQKISHAFSLLLLKDHPFPVFLFGFFTIFLPCGQTIIVFSTCALEGNLWVGGMNGALFALLTSPSLYTAMHAHRLLAKGVALSNRVIGMCALLIGTLALLRGSAEMGWISHWVLNPGAAPVYHFVIY